MRGAGSEAHQDIKAAIRFYEALGWDWMSVVAFMSAKELGMLPRRQPKGETR